MISYLVNGKDGEITDPHLLRIFYTRLYYHENKADKNPRAPRRPQAKLGAQTQPRSGCD
jgi:hypothetical protein